MKKPESKPPRKKPSKPPAVANKGKGEEALNAAFAAEVAHEVANGLQAIIGWSKLLRDEQGLSEAGRRALGYIEEGARSARLMTRRMLTVARESATGQRILVDLTRVVQELKERLEPFAKKHSIRVDVQVSPHLRVYGSREELWTILWNLAKNALEAIAPQAAPQTGKLLLNAHIADEWVEIYIQDNGSGISKDQQARIFEPYFTTKERGTGLGLALVKRTVERLGGTLELASELGQGTRFTLRFPLAKEGVESSSLLPDAPSTSDDTERISFNALDLSGLKILVVENETSLRDLLTTALELRGAHVIAAATGQSALSITSSVDLAIVDLNLASEQGDEVIARLRQAQKVKLAILMTGGDPSTTMVEPDVWLRKPFEISHLMRVMEQLLLP